MSHLTGRVILFLAVMLLPGAIVWASPPLVIFGLTVSSESISPVIQSEPPRDLFMSNFCVFMKQEPDDGTVIKKWKGQYSQILKSDHNSYDLVVEVTGNTLNSPNLFDLRYSTRLVNHMNSDHGVSFLLGETQSPMVSVRSANLSVLPQVKEFLTVALTLPIPRRAPKIHRR